MSCLFHVGDTPPFHVLLQDCDGTPLAMDLATTIDIKFIAPDGDTFTKTATYPIGGDGSDGVVEVLIAAGELDVVGTWVMQPFVVLPDWSGHLSSIVFKVVAPIF